jgi:hypothetical protein
VPGERIVGITYRGKGVVVHAIDCPALAEFEDQPERWVDLHWHSGRHPPVHDVTLDITIGNDAGVLGRICTLIGEQKANISDLTFRGPETGLLPPLIDVDVRDAEHLHRDAGARGRKRRAGPGPRSYVMHRLRRLPDPPHKIARGIAAGVFVSFTPSSVPFHHRGLDRLAAGGNILAALWRPSSATRSPSCRSSPPSRSRPGNFLLGA